MSELCPRCRHTLVTIRLDLAKGARTLRSCSNCDLRAWQTDDGPIALDGLLSDISDFAASRSTAPRR
jgi:hypothetical protein